MKHTEKKKIQILVLVVFLLAVSLYVNYFSPAKSQEFTQPSAAASSRAPVSQLPSYELLIENSMQAVNVKRNIFDFEGFEEEPPNRTQETMTMPSGAMPPMDAPIPNVRYLGFYFEKENDQAKYAAISNTGKVAVGREGEVILSGRYEVVRINPEYVLLKVLPDNKLLRLVLGNKTGQFVDQEEEAE